MEQVLKHVGNSMMLSVSPKSVRQKRIDKTTRLEQVEDDSEPDRIIFRIIRPKQLVFPEIKGELTLPEEIRELLDDPVYPTEESLKNPRIQHLLDENFR